MISVVIPTHESERLLLPTLAALVSGAVAGMVREVILVDAGSTDGTAKVADVAGCRFQSVPGSVAMRLRAGADMARARWLMFLRPGAIPESHWVDEIESFVRDAELADEPAAAVFRRRSRRGQSYTAEFAALAAQMIGGLPKPEQGLLISKSYYAKLGGYRSDAADTEAQLLKAIGRRRIALLDCSVTIAAR